MKKHSVLLMMMLALVMFPLASQASERSLDTTASISFKGENPYKPPIPGNPPKGDDDDDDNGKNNGNNGGGTGGKDKGRLPQTNGTKESYLLFLGAILIATAIGSNHILSKRKRRETIV